MFQRAAMNLREWSSNCWEFVNSLPVEKRVSSNVNKVLGLLWDQLDDTIGITGFDKRLWSMDKSWDEPLSEDLVMECNDIALNICKASSLRLDRFIGRVRSQQLAIL